MNRNPVRRNYELAEEESFAAHAGDSVTPEVKLILCQEKVQIKNDFFPSCQHT